MRGRFRRSMGESACFALLLLFGFVLVGRFYEDRGEQGS